jgi:hypothetical protein
VTEAFMPTTKCVREESLDSNPDESRLTLTREALHARGCNESQMPIVCDASNQPFEHRHALWLDNESSDEVAL